MTAPTTTSSPSSPAEALFREGERSFAARDYEAATQYFNQFLKHQPQHFEAMCKLGASLYFSGRLQLSLRAYEQALLLSSDHPQVLHQIGMCHRGLGDFEKALRYSEQALKIKPDFVGCLYDIINSGRYAPDSAQAKQMLGLYQRKDLSAKERISACFALAKIYEDAGDIAQAFSYYTEANQLQAQQTIYNETQAIAAFKDMERVFTSDLFARFKGRGMSDETPIFIIGMPRSGTTLIEQILASHSKVSGAGEFTGITQLALTIVPDLTGRSFFDSIEGLDSSQYTALAQHYLQRLRSLCPEGSLRITDKMPTNYFYVGFIHLVFPHARIIHCARDPMDTCWSIFRQHFTRGHSYRYDQATLGRYYCYYRHLMHHWQQVLPGRIYEVEYEKMVGDPAAQARALIEHCGLEWEEQCLNFHQTKRRVNTASTFQVRKPIYKTSLKSWEPIADKLAPLREALASCYD